MKHMNTSILIGHSFLRASCYRLDKHSSQIIFGFICALMIGISNLFYPRPSDIMGMDGGSFLYFSSMRPSLYPAFLHVTNSFGENYDGIIFSQIAVHSVSVGVMFYLLAMSRFPLLVMIIFLVSTLFNFYAQEFNHLIMAESLSFSLMFLIIGTFSAFVVKRQRYMLFLAMLFAAILVGVRLSAVPLVISLLLAFTVIMRLWSARHESLWRPLIAAFFPLILVLGAEHYLFFKTHETRKSYLELHLFGKAVMVLALNDDKRIFDDKYQSLEMPADKFQKSARAQIDHFYADGHYCTWLRAHAIYEAYAYFNVANDETTALAETTGRTVEDIKLDFALQVFSDDPISTIKLIAKHYVSFFCVGHGYGAVGNKPKLDKPLNNFRNIYEKTIQLAFLTLGVIFFLLKLRYSVKILPWIKSSKANISSFDIIGAWLILSVVGLNLFASIFSISIFRFLLMSFPLIVLAILCQLSVILETYSSKKVDDLPHA